MTDRWGKKKHDLKFTVKLLKNVFQSDFGQNGTTWNHVKGEQITFSEYESPYY